MMLALYAALPLIAAAQAGADGRSCPIDQPTMTACAAFEEAAE